MPTDNTVMLQALIDATPTGASNAELDRIFADGVGLAATQVDVHERVIVIDISEERDQPLVLINPEIVWASDEMIVWEEGCLSVPEIYADVERPARIRARWQDLDGKVHEEEMDGLMATCLQHEMDHLEGILFIDHLSRLKRQMAETGIKAQALLIPEIVELSPSDASRLLEAADDLARLGLTIEAFGGHAIAVRETPAILGNVSAAALLRDVLDELADLGQSQSLQAKMEAILSRMACHGSIRSGRQMRAEEMNALLREMEATPHSGQCNHGRPTYVELKLHDIERLFGRR